MMENSIEIKSMNKSILKKALLQGTGTGLATWFCYGMLFEMILDKESFKEALFSSDSLIFAGVVIIAEIILNYMRLIRKTKRE